MLHQVGLEKKNLFFLGLTKLKKKCIKKSLYGHSILKLHSGKISLDQQSEIEIIFSIKVLFNHDLIVILLG